jgi:hypothetical protein
MDPYAADTVVAEIRALKSSERRRLATLPTPLVAFALVDLGGVVAVILVGRFHLALYALPAFGLAVWVSARAFSRRALAERVQVSVRPWALTAAALCIGSVSASRAGVLLDVDAVSAVGPFLAQAVALWLLGRWADSDALLVSSALMVVASLLIGSQAAGDLAVALQFGVYGILMLATAVCVAMRGPTT